jgi:hypothetical protein
MTTRPAKKWSQQVTEHSDALDLEHGVFTQTSAKKIAASLKASAERSERRKGSPLQSAMSMLNFYINRAGSTLPEAQRKRLDAAKDELHKLFDPAHAQTPARKGASTAPTSKKVPAEKVPAKKAAGRKSAANKTTAKKAASKKSALTKAAPA